MITPTLLPHLTSHKYHLSGHQQAEFKLNIVSGWNKAEGDFKLFKEIQMREAKSGRLGSGGEAEDSDENFDEDDDE